MQLIPIGKESFDTWKGMREVLYDDVDEAYHLEEMASIYSHQDWYCSFVVDDDEQVIGLVELSSRNIVDGCLSSPVAYLEGLYLEPHYRRKGHGKELMWMLIAWCKKHGFSEFATDTALSNTKAQKFYTSIGFEKQETIVEFHMKIS